MKIYLVMRGDYDYESIDSAFASEAKAKERAEHLQESDRGHDYDYFVTDVEVEGVRLDEEAPR